MTRIHEPALTRSGIYRLLATAFLYPDPAAGGVAHLRDASGRLAREASRAGLARTVRALRRTRNTLSHRVGGTLLDDYIEVFGHGVSGDCPSYEGEYDQADVFQKSQMLADLNACYHAFGVVPSPEIKERPDHISVELDFMHLLTLKEGYALLQGHGAEKVRICRDAQESFLAVHLSPWILDFAGRVARKASKTNAYRALTRLLTVHMETELAMFRLEAPGGRTGAVSDSGTDDHLGAAVSADHAAMEASCDAA